MIVDVQNEFMSGMWTSDGTRAIVPHILKLIEKAKKEREYILLLQDSHNEDTYKNTRESKNFLLHCVTGSEGWMIDQRILDAIQGYERAMIIMKNRFVANDIPDSVDAESMHICGLHTEASVLANAIHIMMLDRDVDVYVHAKACAGLSTTTHTNALIVMEEVGIKVLWDEK
jgi:nicotinamidase-related amidase